MGRSALMSLMTSMKNEYEERGAIWAAQTVDFKEGQEMELITGFCLNKGVVVVALKGSDTPYKKRKMNEEALFKQNMSW